MPTAICGSCQPCARPEVAHARQYLAKTRDLAGWPAHSLAHVEVEHFRWHLAETRDLAGWQTHSLARRACIFTLFSP